MTNDAAKAEARKAGLAARARGTPARGVALAGHVLASLPPHPGALVAGFWPLREEIDPRPLMLALAGRGHGLCLPVTGPRGTALTFRRFRWGDALIPGPFGTAHPSPDADALEPDMLLVPLVAFDDAGGRIGHGAGYYDRTLAGLRARRPIIALGIGYAAQRAASLPLDGLDEPLDAVATEQGVMVIAR